MAYGTEYGLVIVDIVQKVCVMNVASPDLYGSQDPYARTPRSPKRTEATTRDDQARSPSIDQVSIRLTQYLHGSAVFFAFPTFSQIPSILTNRFNFFCKNIKNKYS